MELAPGVVMAGLHLIMRPVLREAEHIWVTAGRPEGVMVTSALDGLHGATSWHYYGCGLDFRTRYFSEPVLDSVYIKLKAALQGYDVVKELDHIHVEPGNVLAARYNLLPNWK